MHTLDPVLSLFPRKEKKRKKFCGKRRKAFGRQQMLTAGTQFTCFTGTKVQKLTSLLALPVQR
jgi:hypothetical protein